MCPIFSKIIFEMCWRKICEAGCGHLHNEQIKFMLCDFKVYESYIIVVLSCVESSASTMVNNSAGCRLL